MTRLLSRIGGTTLLTVALAATPALAQVAPTPVAPPQTAPAPPEKPAQAKTPMPAPPPEKIPPPQAAPAPPEKPAQAKTPMPAPPPEAPAAVAAPDAEMDLVAACKADALGKLKQKSPEIEDIFIDVDGLTVAEADGRLGDTAVKGVLMGEAYIQRDRSDRVHRFLCLTGEKGQVLFTFFTER